MMDVQTTIGEEFDDPLFQRALLDIHMMVALNGAERTVPQWCAALRSNCLNTQS
jgi:hypothetical protein